VRNARDNRAIGGQQACQKIEPAQSIVGQNTRKITGPRAGKISERSRLRWVDLSRDRVGVTVQRFLRLLAAPRSQHHK
jgi:hypothetical protein